MSITVDHMSITVDYMSITVDYMSITVDHMSTETSNVLYQFLCSIHNNYLVCVVKAMTIIVTQFNASCDFNLLIELLEPIIQV